VPPQTGREEAQEIASLRAMRQELGESAAQLRSIIDSALDAIVTIDENNRITEFNPAAEAIFGFRREQVIGRDLGETLIPHGLRAGHRRGLARHLHSSEAPRLGVRLELPALRADGSEFMVELTVTRMAGAPPRFTAFIRDLTQRLAAEREAARLAGQLKASEQQYRTLFMDNPQPMCVYDPESLRFLAVNAAAVAQYGYAEHEFLQMTIEQLRPEQDNEAWQREVFATPLRGLRRHHGRHRKKSGELIWVDTSANDILFHGQRARLVLAVDVTAQRRAALDLRRSEARFRALTQLSADWFWEQDAEFRFVDVSAGGNWPDGLPPAPTILGKRRQELGDLEMDDWAAHQAMLERHEPFRDLEVRRRAVDGTLRLISISGSPIYDEESRFTGYRGVGRDVTERRRAQRQLRESQRMLASVLANLPGMAYRCRNERGWPMEFVSDGAQALTGYAPADFTGGSVRYEQVIHSEDRAMVWDGVQRAVAQRERFQLTYRIMTARGELRWVWEQGAAVASDGNGVVVLEGLVMDITERRRAQEEISRLNAELEERVRQRTAQLQSANAELEAFSYSIAHDLRSPLTSIDGFSHVLAGHECALDERGRHYLRRIRAGVRQMSDLTDALLSLAHLSRVNLRSERVDLAEVVRATLAQLREREPAREVDAQIAPHLWTHGDPRLLAQVMSNLVGNAWKFSSHKPRVVLRVASQVDAHGETVYYVADEGAGFDMAHASRLFGAFQRLHAPSEFEGTGIGLALVQKIVARHGGRIWAQARLGEGATFYFTLASSPA
jgi:PAS domain S-box-containing protein